MNPRNATFTTDLALVLPKEDELQASFFVGLEGTETIIWIRADHGDKMDQLSRRADGVLPA